jgi:Protein of unknown function (DUF3365)
MNKHIPAIILLCCSPVAGSMADDKSSAPEQARVTQGKAVVQEFFGRLKGELEAAIKAGGPVNAIEVCHKTAPAIASELSAKHNMHVARTSMKTRNAGNSPDAWESGVLQKLEARKAAGESPDTLNYSEVVEQNGKKEFRYMQAIIMPPENKMPCLTCHGENIDDKVAAKLKELYPNDQARGYKAGDLRGAFSLRQSM